VTKTLQIGGDNKSANQCQNCRKVTALLHLLRGVLSAKARAKVCKTIRDVTKMLSLGEKFNAGFYAGQTK
jgi:hypothetical protein